MPRERRKGKRHCLGQRMPAWHEHATVPLIAGQRYQFGEGRHRLGGDADVRIAVGSVLGHLQRVALMQDDADLRIARGEIANHRRQHVARLGVRGGNGQRAGILAPVLRADTAQILDLAQGTPRGRHHGVARGR